MRYFAIFVLIAVLFSCKPKQQENNSNKIDTINYTSLKMAKFYRTLPGGDVEKKDKPCTILYNQNELKVNFGDSTWTFPVISTQKKPEGTTFVLNNKRFKEVFITSDELHITTFTAQNGAGNITFM